MLVVVLQMVKKGWTNVNNGAPAITAAVAASRAGHPIVE
jgi:hypothetical protein